MSGGERKRGSPEGFEEMPPSLHSIRKGGGVWRNLNAAASLATYRCEHPTVTVLVRPL